MEDSVVRQGFIAAILGVQPEEIAYTELLQTHLRKEHKDDKLGILDVRVRFENGTQVDMEMQISPFKLWPERSLFYLAKIYLGQMHEGEEYEKLKKCIHIGILDFELFPKYEEYYSRFHIWEDQRRIKYTDKLEIHIFELPKLKRYEYPETELLNWMRFMNAEKKEEFEMLANKNEYMEKAYERLTKISADEQKRLKYEAREKAIRDYNWQMKTNYEDGLAEGEKIGEKKAIKTFIEMCQKLSISKDDVIQQLMDGFSMDETSAEQCVKEYWK